MSKEIDIFWELIDEACAWERGALKEARHLAQRLLEEKFGELPAAVVERVTAGDREWCEDLIIETLGAKSLQKLGF